MTGFPQLPQGMRQVLRGYLHGLSDLVGVKNAKVTLNESDPNAWVWDIMTVPLVQVNQAREEQERGRTDRKSVV